MTSEEQVQDAIQDFNRTLRKKNTGDGYYKCEYVELRWHAYDPELDTLVPSEYPHDFHAE